MDGYLGTLSDDLLTDWLTDYERVSLIGTFLLQSICTLIVSLWMHMQKEEEEVGEEKKKTKKQ